MLDAIKSAWSWTGLNPEEVLRTNTFANVIVRASDGQIWRICPEELSCEVVAPTESRLRELESDPAFQRDWFMEPLVQFAQDELGPLPEGRCYCLKIPAVLGGPYDASNFGTNTTLELVSFAGNLAEQIKDLPEGAKVKLVVE